MIPQFRKHACIDDCIEWDNGPFRMSARLAHDEVTSTDDYDCYSEDEIASWRNDEWQFCGVVVSAHVDGIELGSASIWGVDLNHPQGDNAYLSEVANDCQQEAINEAKAKLAKLCAIAA